jgi:hypothetical protein
VPPIAASLCEFFSNTAFGFPYVHVSVGPRDGDAFLSSPSPCLCPPIV